MRWIGIWLLFASPVWATKVLLIESYHSEYPWDASYVEGLTETFSPEVELITYQMDTKRLPVEQHQSQAEKAFAFYQQHQPEIVILGDDNAMNYLLTSNKASSKTETSNTQWAVFIEDECFF